AQLSWTRSLLASGPTPVAASFTPHGARDLSRNTNICQLPMQPGPCQAYVSRYFYNSVTKKCEKFRYGGCQGNWNRFTTKDECLETCVRPGKRVREARLVGSGAAR
uniref:BPTI/Kunitz inhibitor domain-containing protein n=1 Tax=Chrysemys picta bellii TaxID=8478 RepID=A0A8C3HA69_CHRPI